MGKLKLQAFIQFTAPKAGEWLSWAFNPHLLNQNTIPFSDTWQPVEFPSQFNTFHFSLKKKTEGYGNYIYFNFLPPCHNSSLQWKFPEGKQGKNTGDSSSKAFFFPYKTACEVLT